MQEFNSVKRLYSIFARDLAAVCIIGVSVRRELTVLERITIN